MGDRGERGIWAARMTGPDGSELNSELGVSTLRCSCRGAKKISTAVAVAGQRIMCTCMCIYTYMCVYIYGRSFEEMGLFGTHLTGWGQRFHPALLSVDFPLFPSVVPPQGRLCSGKAQPARPGDMATGPLQCKGGERVTRHGRAWSQTDRGRMHTLGLVSAAEREGGMVPNQLCVEALSSCKSHGVDAKKYIPYSNLSTICAHAPYSFEGKKLRLKKHGSEPLLGGMGLGRDVRPKLWFTVGLNFRPEIFTPPCPPKSHYILGGTNSTLPLKNVGCA